MDSIVLVVMDDTADNVPTHMSEATSLAASGVVFGTNIIASPVCSPSRASLMLGKHPHNHGVLANDWPSGGYGVYHDLEADSFFPEMQAAGYYTALIGKYQNHYKPEGNADATKGATYAALHVPAGLDEALLFGEAYGEFQYTATSKIGAAAATLVDTEGGTFAEADYVTDVMATRAEAAIARAVVAGKPIFLVLTPFATHSGGGDPEDMRFPPAPRHRPTGPDRPGYWGAVNFSGGDCGGSPNGGCQLITTQFRAGDLSANTIVENPTAWHNTATFNDNQLDKLLESHIEQVQMAQAVDEMITDVRAQMVTSGLNATAWYILTSDNGFHLGEHAMQGQKSAPYDHDTKLTLIVRPPGGTTASTVTSIVQNVDLFNTFLDIAGEPEDLTLDGRSIKDFVTGTDPTPWRVNALVALTPHNYTWEDAEGSGVVPAYRAIRSAEWLFVNFDYTSEDPPITGRGEIYDLLGTELDADPWQVVNQYPRLTDDSRADIDDALRTLMTTSGAAHWTAATTPLPALEFGAEVAPDSTECHFLMDDIEFHEPGGRYWLEQSTKYPQLPGKDVPLTTIPGIAGLQLSGKATSRESYWAATVIVTDRNSSGVHGGATTLEENLQDIYLLIGTDDLIKVAYALGGPVEWEFNARVVGDVTPRAIGTDGVALTILFQIASGARRALSNVVWSRSLDVDLNNEIIDVIPDTTKKISDSDVRLTGPFGTIVITDVISGEGFKFRHPDDRNITADEQIIIDTKRRKAFITDIEPDSGIDTWDTSGMDEVSGGLVSFGRGRELFPITPKPGGGGPGAGPDPRNRLAKVDVAVLTVGTRATTAIDIRLKQARP